MNLGNAPVGSIGKPSPDVVYRLVDKDGNDVPDGTPGELIFESRGERKSVEYFKNEKASDDKLRNGWIYTGDLVRRDEKGYLYFVGRNAEFMRIKGENVSAYEVEHTIQKHPSVRRSGRVRGAVGAGRGRDHGLRIAGRGAYAEGSGPGRISERRPCEIRGAAVRKDRQEFPKTETQRIIKKELEKLGIVPGTYDSQKNIYITESKVS